ncbi:helix-turn-helix transcriptional regulator [Pseudodesulfovibrio methanolicus]|uniref:AlpA family phage regulatory protein n=1 Tax=Pseudodesulfovibrio methanolicus TaxID=3126690 RepID=A0ABZ2J332_9BACT
MHPTLPDEGYVRIHKILEVIPIGKSSWWAGVKAGKFPQPVKLGPKTTAWKVEDIRKLIENLSRNIEG